MRLLSGHAGPDVARVAVRLDGTLVTVPLADRWFFAEFAKDPTALVTFDAAGSILREFEISFGPRAGASDRCRSRFRSAWRASCAASMPEAAARPSPSRSRAPARAATA